MIETLPLHARLSQNLQQGMSVPLAAAKEGISVSLGQIIVDDLQRRGLLMSATSLCSSGLGACGGSTSPEMKIHCSGCPLLPLKV